MIRLFFVAAAAVVVVVVVAIAVVVIVAAEDRFRQGSWLQPRPGGRVGRSGRGTNQIQPP